MLLIMSCSKPSPYFFLPIILAQVDLSFISPKNAVPELGWLLQIFWGKVESGLSILEAYEWFTPCGEPSVFALVKSSLDGRHG